MQALGLGINALISSKSDGKRWIDQSPTYTLVAAELSEMFPGARFLHILRDGTSVVHSMINSGFSTEWATDFEGACRTWSVFVGNASQFQEAHPERCLTVPYAALVEDPRELFGQILEFVHAAQHPGPATFFSSNRINSSFQPDGALEGAPRPSRSSSGASPNGPSSPKWPARRWIVTASPSSEACGPDHAAHRDDDRRDAP